MTREVPLSRGYVALVDDQDYERVIRAGSWTTFFAKRNIYARRHFFQPDTKSHKTVRLHNFITGHIGVDHINGDGLDNRRANLRAATASQNGANSRLRIDSKSGFCGVSWSKRYGKWRAQITVARKAIHLGMFVDPSDAARAYDAAALAYFGEFARLNFPQAMVS